MVTLLFKIIFFLVFFKIKTLQFNLVFIFQILKYKIIIFRTHKNLEIYITLINSPTKTENYTIYNTKLYIQSFWIVFFVPRYILFLSFNFFFFFDSWCSPSRIPWDEYLISRSLMPIFTIGILSGFTTIPKMNRFIYPSSRKSKIYAITYYI